MIKINKLFIPIMLTCVLIISFFIPNTMIEASANETSINAKACVLMDYGSGQILKENNSKKHLPIASVTKLTTLLLAFEAIDKGELALDQILVASEHAFNMGGSQVFIDAGAEYKVENLLHSIIISSANDASVMIAEQLAGSEDEFVQKMNSRVLELGGQDTNYVNCSGLPSPNAYSCAYDVALVTREILKHSLYFEISKITLEDFVHPSGRITQMANTNKLLKNYNGCDAGKTGSTNEAGYCFSGTAKRGNLRLISVILGAENSKQRFAECASLFDWGFANFKSECLIDKQKDLQCDFNIKLAKNKTTLKSADDFWITYKKDQKSNIEVFYEMQELKAPISKNSIVGKIIVTQNGVVLKEIDILTTQDVQLQTYFDRVKQIGNNW